MGVIERVRAWEALDSRGTPTIACAVTLKGGAEGDATVPSGASTGGHEARERRDGDARYNGRGVRAVAARIEATIAPAIIGLDSADQAHLDKVLRGLDGTPDLRNLGANAVLAVSVANAIAHARDAGVPLWRSLAPDGQPQLPLPMVNVISGGAHAGALVDIQDFLVIPVGASRFSEAIEWAARVRASTAEELRRRGYDTALVADEGGLAAPLPTNQTALDLLLEGIQRSGLEPSVDVAIAIDVAATQLLDEETYRLASEDRHVTGEELVDELSSWVDRYPIVSIEDALAEDDHDGWRFATDKLAEGIQLIGDDLFATSTDRLRCGIGAGIANALLVKPNQVGTLSDARAAATMAHEAGYATILSARSGETEDSWLADLAVGWQIGQIKVGSTTRSERTAKWNRLLRLEAEHPEAVFAGRSALAPLQA